MRQKYIVNKESKSYLANLLATESLEVQYKKTATASFDVKNRILTLPIWKKDLSERHRFICGTRSWSRIYANALLKKQDIKNKPFVVNVVDARIEKLIKRKYNGFRQSFIRVIELIAKDFLHCKKDINEMLLIDRLNIHFKSSHISSNVKFAMKK